eukprot:TRINITY_DN37201_c0_g1_i1.p1 TRINITY_DN37201_c0_g1~~TRINITY_DN37201_c0_g1_i1.p1  ORF type:complete len:320 (+),score=73.31 TRINITY_DN37201_c0_g1_i1:62-961(+)
MRRCKVLLAAPMHMAGYPVDSGAQGYIGTAGMAGIQKQRFQNRIGDALDWNIIAPEWYWERGGYEKMGNMPPQWKKDGFGAWVTSLTNDEVEMLVYDLLHDMILEENMRDGLEVRAPHPDTGEPLYSKVPSWVYHNQAWSRPDIRERIFDRVCKALRVVPPFHQRVQLTHPIDLVSWFQARVAFARSPPQHIIPQDVKKFLDEHGEQPELGFTFALPPKERTSLRQAMKTMRQMDIDSTYEFKASTKGESKEAKKGMYWLELERNARLKQQEALERTAHREMLIQRRRMRKEAEMHNKR